ncbi:hypothetical protein [Bradyrhizobium diazoefficiens]|uniref:hypothetical protein n=1 Tax=Bradyrhizobium diazoefficiens TaxID=1355477 RepID=UPI00272CC2BB|nr:hypothetical protein [Bradyrhizobium diazoefficiens]WLA68724.1 hypothetical protein QNN01_19950 [Bradyrhizobium diazoefficiens]
MLLVLRRGDRNAGSDHGTEQRPHRAAGMVDEAIQQVVRAQALLDRKLEHQRGPLLRGIGHRRQEPDRSEVNHRDIAQEAVQRILE